MTVGIYLLNFNEPNDIYIGQSSNIHDRFKRHIGDLKGGRATSKLVKAYETYGVPTLQILEECDKDNLNEREIYYINKFDSFIHGLNSAPGGLAASGYAHNSAKFDKETYETIFHMLAYDTSTLSDIAKELNVPATIVMSIAMGRTHKDLQHQYPELWNSILVNNKFRAKPSTQAATNSTSNKYVVSPDGDIHVIFSRGISSFSAKYGLNKSQMSALLLGTIQSHRGWKVYLP